MSTQEWKDKGKAWQNTRKQAERDKAREEDRVEASFAPGHRDGSRDRLASARDWRLRSRRLLRATEAAELTILLFMHERDRDAAQNERLKGLLAAADT